jgi:hypothetical protein
MAEKNTSKQWSGFAIAGFVLSLLFYTSVLGIIFSSIGLAATSKGKKRGRGLAIAGLVIGIVFIFFILIGAMWLVVNPLIEG